VISLWLLVARHALAAYGARAASVYRIAYLSVTLSVELVRENPVIDVLRELGRLGYAQGRNLKMEFLSAEGRPDRLSNIVAQPIDSKPDAILVTPSGGSFKC